MIIQERDTCVTFRLNKKIQESKARFYFILQTFYLCFVFLLRGTERQSVFYLLHLLIFKYTLTKIKVNFLIRNFQRINTVSNPSIYYLILSGCIFANLQSCECEYEWWLVDDQFRRNRLQQLICMLMTLVNQDMHVADFKIYV